MGFWQKHLRTFWKMRPKLLPYPLGTLHNTLDIYLGVHRPILGRYFGALACRTGANPGIVFHKDLAMGHFAASGSAPSSCFHNTSWHLLHHIRHVSRPQQCTQKMRTPLSYTLATKMRLHLFTISAPAQKCEHCPTVHLKNANHCLVHSRTMVPLHTLEMRTVTYGIDKYIGGVHSKNAEGAYKKCGGHINIVVGIQILLRAYKNADTIQKVWTAFLTLMQALDTHCRHQKCEQHPGAVHKKCG